MIICYNRVGCSELGQKMGGHHHVVSPVPRPEKRELYRKILVVGEFSV